MQYIPFEDEQTWIISNLKKLIEQFSPERFLYAPLVEATTQFFPDTLYADGESVWKTAKRLLIYAGLGTINPLIEVINKSQIPDSPVVAYVNTVDNDFIIGIVQELFDDPLQLVSSLSHEVAHCFRKFHKLEIPDLEEEELLTDLTAMYLGFGLLITNTSYRYRSSGSINHIEFSSCLIIGLDFLKGICHKIIPVFIIIYFGV